MALFFGKVITREKEDAKEAFLRPWTPPAQISTFGRYLNKHQKLCKAIGITISDTNKILFFVVQMYDSKIFTEEEIMEYKILLTNDKYDWSNNLTYFTALYAMQKACSEDRAAESVFESAANINHIAPEMIVNHASINLDRGGAIGTPEDEATTAYHDYVEGLKELLLNEKNI